MIPTRIRNNELKMEVSRNSGGTLVRIETTGNETGMLFRISAVFYVHNWSIVTASIQTPGNQIVDEFLVRCVDSERTMDRDEIAEIREDLVLLLDGMSVLEYLSMRQARVPGTPSRKAMQGGVEIVQEACGPVIRLRGVDRPGLMLALSQTFFLTDIDILNATLHTEPTGEVINSFEVNPSDARFFNQEFRRRLCDELRYLL